MLAHAAWKGFNRPDAAWRRYGGAVAAVVVATLLSMWLSPLLKGAAFSLFLAAVVIVGWFGGLGPCLLAQGLTLAVLLVSAEPDPDSPPEPAVQIWVGLAAFFFVGIVAGVLSDSMRAARRRAREEAAEAVSQREQLRAVLSCMGDGVLVTDNAGRTTMINPVAETLTGWTAAAAVGRPVRDVLRMRDEQSGEAAADPVERVLRDGPVVHCDRPVLVMTTDGRQLPIDYTAARVTDPQNRNSGVVLIFRDETARRQTEQILRDADRRKDEFLATLAHELRNPLAPIRTGLDLLKLCGRRPETLDSVLPVMEQQTQQMVRLIDDLLDVSRITRGKLQLRRGLVNLAEVVQSAVDATRPFIDEAGHELLIDVPGEPLFLDADPHRLAQVFANLLNNAARYTPGGGRITLSARCRDGQAVVSVRDTGIGIAPEMRTRIFEMFTQLERPMEAPQTGLGIGLTLVKSLIELHGGSVEVHSDGHNCGSEFIVSLPVLTEPAVPAAAPASEHGPPSAAPQRRVLIADDNPAALETLSLMLEVLGHDVRSACDGREAIRVAGEYRPDIILMDLGMPNVDGCEAARQIRAQLWGREMLLVATTGWGQEDDRRRTREAGFDHHLVKPVEAETLRHLLNGATTRKVSSPAPV